MSAENKPHVGEPRHEEEGLLGQIPPSGPDLTAPHTIQDPQNHRRILRRAKPIDKPHEFGTGRGSSFGS